MNFKKHIIIFIGMILFLSCSIQMKVNVLKDGEEAQSEVKIIVENTKEKTYKGWWVYGEGQHIFKDEQTLDEYDLEFLNENMEELRDLYLAVSEMEYFPMECAMTGHLKKDVLERQNTLIVSDFEILYIEGCGE
jgi:hypothetical protein